MTDHVQQYARTHDRHGSPLPVLRSAGSGDLQALAEAAHLPVATVRAARSYYHDLRQEEAAIRCCVGTSCVLGGASAVHEALSGHRACSPVYCLGYCDRSPALLLESGRAVVSCDAATAVAALAEPPPDDPGPPAIRCAGDTAVVTRRVGKGDFSSLEAARGDGAYEALRAALETSPGAVIDAVEQAGARGRGGAAFPTGRKWRMCAGEAGDRKYVIANGDEGDPGSFIDRVLMECDPHGVLEGVALCAYAVGAREGIIFVRSEYPRALERMTRAVDEATAAGMLGPSVLGSDFALTVQVVPGLGSYVCGEETAMINAIEGLRGEVRIRPPYPTRQGLYGRPTVVDNVETLVNIPWILERGPETFAALGTQASSGTKAICLNRGFARPGIVEVEFGLSLRTVIEDLGGGARDGRDLDAVLLGGPMGSVVVPGEWDVPLCYAALADAEIRLGHGGVVAVPEGTDYRRLLVHWLQFMEHESCGKCAPCSFGSRRTVDLARRVADEGTREALEQLLLVISDASLCAFGQEIPKAVRQIMHHFDPRIRGEP